MPERQPIWSLPPKAAAVYFILFPALTFVGVVFVVLEQVSGGAGTSPAAVVAVYQGTAAVAFASAAIAFIIVDIGWTLMGLATALQELRERKREEEERRFQKELDDARREERERIVAFYREQAEKTGQDFVEPPEDPAAQNGSDDR
ncbi:MAG: hypothetical protein OXE05_09010 [Chloroflexi bacterium]|nr:hypothetical protein [Chloroflexota bacterium]